MKNLLQRVELFLLFSRISFYKTPKRPTSESIPHSTVLVAGYYLISTGITTDHLYREALVKVASPLNRRSLIASAPLSKNCAPEACILEKIC